MAARRTVRMTVAALVAGVALVGCTGDDGGDRQTSSLTTRADDPAAAYVGLTEQQAVARAEDEGRPWRIGREDDEVHAVTQDFVENRITFELDDGKVTSATLG